MKNDTMISALILLVLAYLLASEFLYFYSFVCIIILVILLAADYGTSQFTKSKQAASLDKKDAAHFDHHANAGSYAGPMEGLGHAVATVVSWPLRVGGRLLDSSQSEKK